MKNFKLGIFFLLISLVSCSSDSDATVDNPTNTQPEAQYFTYKLDGHDVQFTVMSALRSENMVLISGSAADGTAINLNFNVYGDIGEGMAHAPNTGGGGSSFKHLYAYDKENHFTFNLLSVANGQVKGIFSGKVYEDEYDLTSEFSTVEGTFLLTYTEMPADNPGIGLQASINGNDWHWTTASQGSGSSGNSLGFDSDNKYSFDVIFNAPTVATGTYAFNSESTFNKVRLFSSEGPGTSIAFETAGTLTITSVTSHTQNFMTYKTIEGTFSFTATNPETGATVTVSNGSFKGTYEYQ